MMSLVTLDVMIVLFYASFVLLVPELIVLSGLMEHISIPLDAKWVRNCKTTLF